MTHRTNREFADYLDMVGNDYAESGSEATAEDYHEAASRIRRLADWQTQERRTQADAARKRAGNSPSVRYAPTHGGYPDN